MKFLATFKKPLIATCLALALYPANQVVAWDIPSDNTDTSKAFTRLKTSGQPQFIFNPKNPTVKSKGLYNIKGTDGQPLRFYTVDYGRGLKSSVYLPIYFDDTMSGGALSKYTNKNNASILKKYLKGGAYANDSKNGATDPLGHNAEADLGPNTGHIYTNGFWGETRYIG